jgi:hypothetical protein
MTLQRLPRNPTRVHRARPNARVPNGIAMSSAPASGALWGLAGIVPIAAAAALSAWAAPHPLAPASLAVIVPALIASVVLGSPGAQLNVLIPVTTVSVYLLASIPILLNWRRAWHWCMALFVACVVASSVHFVYLWSSGVRHQGAAHTRIVLILNIACAAMVGGALARTHSRLAPRNVAFCQIGLFLWINWVGFPWLGEAP